MRVVAALLVVGIVGGAFAPSDPPRALDFTHDVLPVLQRQGCASAYCHGSATGRAGFKLSLFGSDAAADHRAITVDFGGRRVDHADPPQSLLLQKALGRLDHGGGRRLPRDGAAHARLREWITAGAPWRDGPERTLQQLRAEPRGERIAVEATYQLADGSELVRDASDVARFATTDPTVVDVEEGGALRFVGPGRAHVTVRLGQHTAVVPFVRSFGQVPPADVSSHELDRAWGAHLTELGLAAAPPVDPALLARRLHLDLAGRPPTPAELDAFVAAPDVAAAVARLTARPEFAAEWGAHLARWFEVGFEVGFESPARGAAADRFVAAVARGDSLPAIVRRVVRGELGGLDRTADPRDRAEYAGRTLLGLRIGCARCHDHPGDRWRQHEHQAFSACFAPPRPDGAGGTMTGAMFDADSGEQVVPRFLDLSPAAAAPGVEKTSRRALAEFVLAEDHDAFATNASNRIFAMLFGRSLVEPLDDHRPGNPPRAAGMLQALVAAFHRGEGRLVDLLAFVMTSKPYALQGALPGTPGGGPAAQWFAAATSRPLAPPAYERALTAVVGRAPAGPLPTSPLARELALRNGAFVHQLVAGGGTTVDATFELCGSAEERLAELWRTVLSRAPRPDEVERFLPLAAGDLAAFRDLAYALLAGREFGHRR